MDRLPSKLWFVFMSNFLFIFYHHCVGQTVSFSTKSDDILLVGQNVRLLCSVTDTTDEDVTMVMTDEMGEQISSIQVLGRTDYTHQTENIKVTRNRTFFCNVTWLNFQATVNLSILPLPSEPTHCFTNYTDGLFIGQVITSECYSTTAPTNRLIMWISDSGIVFTQNRTTIRNSILSTRIDVQPSLGQNGTVFTCERADAQTDQDRCSVGPVYVYDKLTIFIYPAVDTDSFTLHSGESIQYNCSSSPSSDVKWITPERMEGSGIKFVVVGSVINVTVPSGNTFAGDFDLECVGSSLNHTSSAVITVSITTTSISDGPNPSESNVELLIALGGVGACVAIVVIVVMIASFIRWKRSGSKGVIKSDDNRPTESEYASPPAGFDRLPGTEVINIEMPSMQAENAQTMVNKTGGKNLAKRYDYMVTSHGPGYGEHGIGTYVNDPQKHIKYTQRHENKEIVTEFGGGENGKQTQQPYSTVSCHRNDAISKPVYDDAPLFSGQTNGMYVNDPQGDRQVMQSEGSNQMFRGSRGVAIERGTLDEDTAMNCEELDATSDGDYDDPPQAFHETKVTYVNDAIRAIHFGKDKLKENTNFQQITNREPTHLQYDAVENGGTASDVAPVSALPNSDEDDDFYDDFDDDTDFEDDYENHQPA